MYKAILILCSAIFSACATVEIKRITDSTYTDGLRFYRPEPYLLVTRDKDDKLQTAVIYLPNKTQEYALRTIMGIGAIEMNATLTDGWNLTVIGAKIDSKVPETITAISGALSAVRGAAATAALEPGLYRIAFDENSAFANRLVGPLKVE